MNTATQKRWIGVRGVMLAGILMVMLGLPWVVAGSAQAPITSQPPQIATIEEVGVVDLQGRPVVRLKSTRPLEYTARPFRDQRGIVLEIPGASLGFPAGVQPVEEGPIMEILTAQKQRKAGPAVEIRISLAEASGYFVVSEGDTLYVHLEPPDRDLQSSRVKRALPPGPSPDARPEAAAASRRKAQAGQNAVSPARRLLDLLVSSRPDGTRVVLIGDGALSDYRAFALARPSRVVVDLAGVRPGFKDRKFAVNARDVARVRVGIHPRKIRLVFDMADETGEIPAYRLERDHGKLVVRFGEIAEAGAQDGGGSMPAFKRAFAAEPREIVPSAVVHPESLPPWATAVPMWAHVPGGGVVDETNLGYSSPAPAPSGPKRAEQGRLAALSPIIEETIRPDGRDVLGDDLAWTMLMARSTPQEEPKGDARTGASGNGGLQRGSEPGSRDRAVSAEGRAVRPGKHALFAEVWKKSRYRKPGRENVPKPGTTAVAPQGSSREGDMKYAANAPPSDPISEKAVSLAQILLTEEDFPISTGMEPGKVYVGQKINLDFQDIDIHNVFRLLAEVSNQNIIVSDKVKGKVTMRLRDIPWDQALDLILSTHKLGMIRQGNVIRVATLKDLMSEEKERRRLREEKLQEKIQARQKIEEAEIERKRRQRALRPFETASIVLNYTKAGDVLQQIKGFLTKETDIHKVGTAIVDPRTNTITINDYPEKIQYIEEYIKRVDKPTPQVLIETRIVKANKNFARELGIQWGGQYADYEKSGKWAWGVSSGLGGASPSTWSSESFSSGTGRDFFPLSSWMVNLPATFLLGPTTPAIGFQVGRLVGDLVNLDLRLSAAETEGLTKIISRPKIMTLDNVEATIAQGFEIPFTQVNPEGNVSVVFKEATLKTIVTPLISADNRVRLKLDVTDDFPDFSRVNENTGDPTIRKRAATTEVRVRNGETVVIGGIMEETRSYTEAGVPWFRDIPVLGWLFEKKTRSVELNELLIFITPFIVEST